MTVVRLLVRRQPEGGFKSHEQIRKMFTLHFATWKYAKSRSAKAEKIIPNKMKGFTCQLTVLHRFLQSFHPWGQRKIFLKWKSICIFKCALNKLFNNDFFYVFEVLRCLNSSQRIDSSLKVLSKCIVLRLTKDHKSLSSRHVKTPLN